MAVGFGGLLKCQYDTELFIREAPVISEKS